MEEKEKEKSIEELTREVLELAENSDGYLVTISRREGDRLLHWQYHNFDFYYKDLLPSIEEVKKLIMSQYHNLLPSEGVNN